MSRASCNCRRNAFTLVEAIVVICILALMASGSLIILSGALRNSLVRAMAADVMAMDQWARTRSRTGRVTLELDLDRQRMIALADSGEQKELRMSKEIGLKEVLWKSNVLKSGVLRFGFHAGDSSTYAMLLATARRQSTWYVFSGPTGQCYSVEQNEQNDKQIRAWFARWAYPR